MKLTSAALALLIGCTGLPGPRSDRPGSLHRRAATESWHALEDPSDADTLPSGPLTLEQALDIARARNPDLQIAEQRIRQAEEGRREVAATLLPTLSVDTGYVRADAPSVYLFKTIDARRLRPGTSFNRPGTFENFEAGVTARYNLFNGGQDRLAGEIAQADHELSQFDRSAVMNALLANVILSYFDVQVAEAIAEATGATTETVRAQLRETEVKWREGRVLKSDVLSLEVRLAGAEEQRIRAENARRLAAASLANLLGFEPSVAIDLSGDEWPAIEVPPVYEDGLAEALLNRPELQQARLRIDRANLALAASRRAYLPRVDLEARAYWDDPDFELSTTRTNWFAGIALSWDIFQGGRRAASARRTEALLEEMQAGDRRQVLAIQLEVKRAYLSLEEARARVAVTEASVAQAEETLTLVRTQYEGGTATVTRYLETELAWTQAKVRRSHALFDLRKAQAEVARALGHFSDASDMK